MKKNIVVLSLVLSLFAGIMFQTKKAQAGFLILPTQTYDLVMRSKGNALPFLGCILLLPLCVLDENHPSVTSFSTQELEDNGYTAEEAELILLDQDMVVKNLSEEGKMFRVLETDTPDSIANDLKAIHPNVSDTYVHFLLENSL